MSPIACRLRHSSVTLAALAAILWASAGCGPRAPASDLTVTKLEDTNDGECSGRDCSLREAVVAANATTQSETIHLPEGTYTLSLAGSGEDAAASGDLDLVGEVTLTVDTAAEGAAPVVVVDAGGLDDRAFHVLSGSATFIGFTVQGGEADGGGAVRVDSNASLDLQQVTVQGGRSTGDSGGGGIYNEGTLTLEESSIDGGHSASLGGGLANRGTATLVDSSVRNSTAFETGGGIANAGTITMTGGTIQLNYAREKDYPAVSPTADGGGLANLGTATLTNVNVTDNHASDQGGGIANQGTLEMTGGRIDYDEAGTGAALMVGEGANVTMSGVTLVGFGVADGGAIYIGQGATATLTGLVATGKTNGDGGVIYNAGQLTLADSVIENGVGNRGGGIYNVGELDVAGTTFRVNKARIEGGGIYSSTQLRLVASTLEQNEAVTGGALFIAGTGSLENCTVSGNTADTRGGGVETAEGTIQMTHCTVSANTAPEGAGLYYQADLQLANSIIGLNTGSADCAGPGQVAGRGNLQADGSCGLPLGGNQVGVDPLLGRLLADGDQPATHALLSGSPAIDAADPLLCQATDERGISRPQGAACDSGAFESETSTEATLVPVGTAGYTPAPGETLAVVLGLTACRRAPESAARTLITLADRSVTPVVGRTGDSTWLQIVPVGRATCWIAADGVSLRGSLDRVPVVTP